MPTQYNTFVGWHGRTVYCKTIPESARFRHRGQRSNVHRHEDNTVRCWHGRTFTAKTPGICQIPGLWAESNVIVTANNTVRRWHGRPFAAKTIRNLDSGIVGSRVTSLSPQTTPFVAGTATVCCKDNPGICQITVDCGSRVTSLSPANDAVRAGMAERLLQRQPESARPGCGQQRNVILTSKDADC